ncbi:MAG: Ca2+-binding EF-hand superfamily protein, partial [Myxococcota bacterium]
LHMLGQRQQEKLDRLFQLIDIDGSGFIEFSDMQGVMNRTLSQDGHAAGSPVYDAAEVMLRWLWEAIKGEADTDSDEKVSATEWSAMWTAQLASDDAPLPEGDIALFEDLPSLVRRVHLILAQAMGINANRGADLATYQRFLAPYGEPVVASAEAAFGRLDLDGNGLISIDELQQLTAEYFLSNDDVPGNSLFG